MGVRTGNAEQTTDSREMAWTYPGTQRAMNPWGLTLRVPGGWGTGTGVEKKDVLFCLSTFEHL